MATDLEKRPDGEADARNMSTIAADEANVSKDDFESDPHAASFSVSAAGDLPKSHQDYLISRHGTLDLDPIPSDDPSDPLNSRDWMKLINLILVAFHSMVAAFTTSCIIPAFDPISQDLKTSLTKASYLSSIQIAIASTAPFFWAPISTRYGRRPVWLASTLGSLLFNVGCALSPSYDTVATCRAFNTFFASPAMALGSATVTETYFKKQRAQYMGLWTLLISAGIPLGPVIMGIVTYQTGNYRWIYWILAIINGVQFMAYIFFGLETRYLGRSVEHGGSASKPKHFRRIDPTPFRLWEVVHPFSLFRYATICTPGIAYAIVFGFAIVLLTVDVPQVFVPKFDLNPQQLGLQFLGMVIGGVIGELLGGKLSDFWMARRAKSLGRTPNPEFRLWLSYAGFLLVMVGLIVYGVQLQHARQGHWNVTPVVGIALAAAGNQLVTTVLVTYCVDAHVDHSASIGVFINFMRNGWGFIGPFWFPHMLETLGLAASGGLGAGIVFVASVIPTALVQWRGQRWREPRSKAV